MKLYWTSKGRVVYDRKKHSFSFRDLLRIGQRLGAPIFRITPTGDRDIFGDVITLLADDTTGTISPATYGEFGGGTFGGSGATREVGELLTVGRIVIIIEESV